MEEHRGVFVGLDVVRAGLSIAVAEGGRHQEAQIIQAFFAVLAMHIVERPPKNLQVAALPCHFRDTLRIVAARP